MLLFARPYRGSDSMLNSNPGLLETSRLEGGDGGRVRMVTRAEDRPRDRIFSRGPRAWTPEQVYSSL
jgi:hypothetical protein